MRRPLFNLLATVLAWTFTTLLFIVFYSACLNPSRQVLISVNAYGEMWPEMVLFAIIWALVTLNLTVVPLLGADQFTTKAPVNLATSEVASRELSSIITT